MMMLVWLVVLVLLVLVVWGVATGKWGGGPPPE